MKLRIIATAMSLFVVSFGRAQAAPSPEQKCAGGKIAAAGKLTACLAKAEKKRLLTGDEAAYTEATGKCSDKFQGQWQKLEQAAANLETVCPSTGDQVAVESDMTAFADCLATRASGTSALSCLRAVPATGQTAAHGPGTDGDLRAGAALSFVDNGDGTLTDINTALMWEKKDDSGGVHDMDNSYTLTTGYPHNMDGTVVTDFLDILNDVAGGGANCFADYCDWRMPNVRELHSIVEYNGGPAPAAAHPAFHDATGCSGCTDVTAASCTCTGSAFYWSNTFWGYNPEFAWFSPISGGGATQLIQSSGASMARAVRGGL
jgi:hypothetical protein